MVMRAISMIFIGILACIAAAAKQIIKELQVMTHWIDFIFYGSVDALILLARLLGITYQEINVLIFCIAWPLVTLLMAAAILKLLHKNQDLSRQLTQEV